MQIINLKQDVQRLVSSDNEDNRLVASPLRVDTRVVRGEYFVHNY